MPATRGCDGVPDPPLRTRTNSIWYPLSTNSWLSGSASDVHVAFANDGDSAICASLAGKPAATVTSTMPSVVIAAPSSRSTSRPAVVVSNFVSPAPVVDREPPLSQAATINEVAHRTSRPLLQSDVFDIRTFKQCHVVARLQDRWPIACGDG